MKSILILFSFISLISSAQTYSVKKDSLFSFLYFSKGNINDINIFNNQYNSYLFLPIKISSETPSQKLIKNNNGLYILIDGTGQVYKAIASNKDSISFARVDSTIYFGHNFSSIKFSYLDSIYNFGGTGYWHFFGHLIYFHEGSEWEIIKLNNEYHVNSNISYFDADKGELYYIQVPYDDASTTKYQNKILLYKLNINTKKNELIGNVREDFIKYIQTAIYFRSKKLNGLICQFRDNFYLFNFNKNEISTLKNKNLINALIGTTSNHNCAIFEKDSLIYIAGFEKNKELKAYNFKMSDFELTNHQIYYEANSNLNLIIAIIFGVIIILYFFYIKLIKIKVKNNSNKPIIANDLDFNEVEKTLIDLLISKANNEQFCDVDELNKILGLSKKTLEVQKKLRTEQIHRINHKFKVNYNIDIDLIERHKTEEDRRFKKYGISKANSLIYKRK
jgi:hypothetical protein